MDQIEQSHQIEIPQNLIDQEVTMITQNLADKEKEKNKSNNEKIAKSRIKIGLVLNEYGEKIILKYQMKKLNLKYKNKLKECLTRKNGN